MPWSWSSTSASSASDSSSSDSVSGLSGSKSQSSSSNSGYSYSVSSTSDSSSSDSTSSDSTSSDSDSKSSFSHSSQSDKSVSQSSQSDRSQSCSDSSFSLGNIENADLGNLGTAGTIPKFAATGLADSLLTETANGINLTLAQDTATWMQVANVNNHAGACAGFTAQSNGAYQVQLIQASALRDLGWAGLTDLGLGSLFSINANGLLICNYSNTWMKFATNNIVRMVIAADGTLTASGPAIIGTGAAETNAQLTMREAGAFGGIHVVTATANSVRWIKASADSNAKYTALWQYGSGVGAGTMFGAACANAGALFGQDASTLLIGTISSSATYLPIVIGQSASGGDRACISIAAGGGVTIASLAGTGTRNVVVDANGVLSAP